MRQRKFWYTLLTCEVYNCSFGHISASTSWFGMTLGTGALSGPRNILIHLLTRGVYHCSIGHILASKRLFYLKLGTGVINVPAKILIHLANVSSGCCIMWCGKLAQMYTADQNYTPTNILSLYFTSSDNHEMFRSIYGLLQANLENLAHGKNFFLRTFEK